MNEPSTVMRDTNRHDAMEGSAWMTSRSDNDNDDDDDDDDWETLDAVVAVSNVPEVSLMSATRTATVDAQSEPTTTQAAACKESEGLLRRHRPSSSCTTSSVVAIAKSSVQPRNGSSAPIVSPDHGRSNNAQQTTSTSSSLITSKRRSPSIVTHPMQHIGLHFALHLMRQVFGTATDVTFRLALLCFLGGAIARTIECSLWYVLHPQWLIWNVSLFLGVGSLLYFHYQPRLHVWMQTLQSTEQMELDEWLGQCLDTNQLRWLMALCWFLIPALLELRTLQFLTSIVCESLLASTFILASFLGLYVYDMMLLYAARQTRDYVKVLASRKYTQFGLYGLYGTALLCTVYYHTAPRQHIPSLAARFLLSTGVLLYQSSNTDSSLVVRNALRYTVRDALQQVGTSVQQDELLQLTMLRWIVDFWSSSTWSPKEASSETHRTDAKPPPTTTPTRWHRSTRPSEVLHQFRQAPDELNWTDLCPMLQTTTRQMNSEVNSLQHHGVATNRSDSVVSPVCLTTVDVKHAGEHASHTTASSSYGTDANSGPSTAASGGILNEDLFCGSVQSLQAMLSSMNLDEQAQPAVVAYKNLVNSFPPSRRTAIALGASQRMAAIVLLVVSCMLCLLGFHCRPLTWSMVLLPFVCLEVVRIRFWMEACQLASVGASSSQRLVGMFDTVDPMTILLMDVSHHEPTGTPPPLLLVWRNINASVEALEASLTTARCVQTTVVAADFAANVISLANFGLEVSRYGWLHGASIVAKELWHLQSSGTDVRTLWHGVAAPEGSSITSAAVSVIRNSQTISRNMQVLTRDGAAYGAVVGQTLGFLAVIVGQGWFWGREEEQAQATMQSSMIQIVEIDDERASAQQKESNDGELQSDDTPAKSNDLKDSMSGDSAKIALDATKLTTGIAKDLSLWNSATTNVVTMGNPSCTPTDSEEGLTAQPDAAGTTECSSSCDKMLNDVVDSIKFGPIEGGALSVSSDDECLSEDVSGINVIASSSWDESDDFGTVEYHGNLKNSQTELIEEVESSGSSKNMEHGEEDDNLWLKVGGGLAVIGAVVAGSVALLAATNGNQGPELKRKDRKKSIE